MEGGSGAGGSEESRRNPGAVHGGEKQVQGGGEVKTLFIDNLSKRISRRTLWEWFSNHGVIERVFIPAVNRKAKYKNTTFAFITVAEREDAKRIIGITNGVRLDGFVIKVSLAKYPRPTEAMGNKRRYQGKTPVNGEKVERGTFKTNQAVHRERDDRTYREALLNNHGDTSDRINTEACPLSQGTNTNNEEDLLNFRLPVQDTEWLHCCLVGLLKNSFEPDFVQRALGNDNIEVKITKWGIDNDSVVVMFKAKSIMEDAWDNKKEELCYWFEHISPLLLNGVPQYYFKIQLLGVPLYCWHKDFFSSLGNRLGIFISVSEGTMKKEQLDKATITIRAVNSFNFPRKITLKSMGFSYCVRLKVAGGEEGNRAFESGSGSENGVFGGKTTVDQFSNEEGSDEQSEWRSVDQNGFGSCNEEPANINDPSRNQGRQENIERDILSPNSHGTLRAAPNDDINHVDNDDADVESWDESYDHVGINSGGVGYLGPSVRLDRVGSPNREVQGPVVPLAQDSQLGHINEAVGLEGNNNLIISIDRSNQILRSFSSSAVMEFVPDSLDSLVVWNLENSSSHCLPKNPTVLSKLPPHLSLFRADNRRRLRQIVRDSLESEEMFRRVSPVASRLREEASEEGLEAESVWEVSKLLEISFKGGYRAVVDKVRDLEGELRSSS
ncbi:hypothetical protein HRI_002573600 [Hibiscus trionum]|uniref:RRM domain-containing protein n=1 Tax=Hibiscus trionum TaxID=183268 RepID=A0A9W7M5T9_HIBTR|nr:hypothetical protein HRI_002573600 [Hibiscus trionum]